MKLIIQIPCYNEEATLALALKELPRKVEGFDQVEFLVIDDGSADATSEIARKAGVEHIVRHATNLGLARAFMTGLRAALQCGADVIVNTDADNQYAASDIPILTEPILKGESEYVIGTRPIASIGHWSFSKKILQKFGSFMVRKISGTDVQDAPSGFRAITRSAALRINVFNDFTYTLETIIQAGYHNIRISCVDIHVNKDLRPPRLFRSIPQYIRRSVITMLRIAIIYRPFPFFMTIGIVLMFLGTLPGIRFLWHFFAHGNSGMLQSLILGTILLVMGFFCIMMAFIADLLSVNRKLLEDIQYNLRVSDLKK